jgi:hypothetical protein
MKKIQILGLALVAVFAFGVIIAASASAEEFLLAQWLVAGALVTSALPSLSEGEILLHNTKTGLHIVCSFHAEGTIGPNSLDTITEVLSLTGVKTGTPLANETEALLCKSVAGCENSATDIEVWPVGLPWQTEVELAEPSGKFFDLIFKAKYELLCLVLGIASSEECTAAEGTAAEVVNAAGGGVEAAEKPASPNASCTIGGAESGENVPLAGNLTTSSEGAVTVSE